MKLYNKIAALFFCSLILLPSCKDWDFETDSSYDGLFRTPKIEATEIDATFIDLLWNKVPRADYYTLELSEDSLEFTTGLKQFGEDKSIKENKYIIEKLLGNTRYSVRIKAFSNQNIKESEWATYTFKTKSEQILNEVTEITGSSAVLTWNSEMEVDTYTLYEGGGTTGGIKHSLTAEEIVSGRLKLTNLKEATTYRVLISLGEVVRGTRTFTTTESFPEDHTIVTLAEGDDFTTVLAAQTGKVVIVFPKESDTQISAVTIPSAVTSIVFWGATGGTEKPALRPKAFTAEGTLELIRFYNLTLYNDGPGGDYVLNQNKIANIQTVSIENCNIKETRGVIRVQSNGGKESTIKNIEITNTIFTNIGSYGIISTKDMTDLGTETINISKCTFNVVKAGALLNVHQENLNILINQCTFFECIQSGKPYVDFNKIESINATVNNSLFGRSNEFKDGVKVRAGSIKGKVSSENVYYTSDCIWDSGYEIGTAHSKTSEEVFEDAINGNFKIKDPGFTAVAGDPRWLE